MENTILERIGAYLIEKRAALGEWLSASPAEKKTVLLASSNQQAVLDHLGAIEQAIEETESGALGICRICGGTVEDELLEVDYTADVCLSHLSAQQIGRLEDELELARTVQKALLPQEVPTIPGLDVAAYSRPAEFVSGDYFDFIDFGAGSHGLVIADVAGHGVSASLQMASFQALTRAIVPASTSPAEVAARIHGLFSHNIHFTTFVTLFIGAYSPATRTLTYCNAGHNPPLVFHPDHSQASIARWLRPTGPAIGLVEVNEFGQAVQTLYPGDLLVLYTDGVIEATDSGDNLFGTERLLQVVERLHDSSPKEVIRGIRETIEEFVVDRPLSDDVTLVVCSIT
jgi:sigma-B regulation protein RsbU (phosphoserine phosphatase)